MGRGDGGSGLKYSSVPGRVDTAAPGGWIGKTEGAQRREHLAALPGEGKQRGEWKSSSPGRGIAQFRGGGWNQGDWRAEALANWAVSSAES